MTVLLWIFQVLLALHTATGAAWKLTNSEQTVPSLSAIPHGIWLTLIGLEVLCSLGLIAPAIGRRFAILAPIAAIGIATEMLVFTGLNLTSGYEDQGSVIYWLVVAAFAGFIAYGRLRLKRA
ncbi:MAG: DoxX family protein [Acidobacteriota bacterium]